MLAEIESGALLVVGILMSVEFYRESPGKFDSRTLSRETLSRWIGRMACVAKGTAFVATCMVCVAT